MSERTQETKDATLSLVIDKSDVGLQWESLHCDVRALDPSSFVADCPALVRQHESMKKVPVMNGTLTSDVCNDIPVLFRIKECDGELARCDFFDLSSSKQARIDFLIERLREQESAKQKPTPAKTAVYTPRKPRGILSRSFGWVLIATGLLLLLSKYVIPSEGKIKVRDGMVGQHSLIVRAPNSGRLIEMLVNAGDSVQAGEVLARLAPGNSSKQIDTLNAKVKASEDKLALLQIQSADVDQKIEVVKVQAIAELKAAEATRKQVAADLEAAEEYLVSLQPLVKDENIGFAEVEQLQTKAKQKRVALKVQEQKVQELQRVARAAKNNRLVQNDGDELSTEQLEAEIAQTQATIASLKRNLDAAKEVLPTIDIRSPQDGVIHAVHVAMGEKCDQLTEALELRVNQGVIATGFIAPERANSVTAGLPVEVEIPSTGQKINGEVANVGQLRKLNLPSEGRLPTDVAVQVKLDDSVAIPQGERLRMTVLGKSQSVLGSWLFGSKDDKKATPSS